MQTTTNRTEAGLLSPTVPSFTEQLLIGAMYDIFDTTPISGEVHRGFVWIEQVRTTPTIIEHYALHRLYSAVDVSKLRLQRQTDTTTWDDFVRKFDTDYNKYIQSVCQSLAVPTLLVPPETC